MVDRPHRRKIITIRSVFSFLLIDVHYSSSTALKNQYHMEVVFLIVCAEKSVVISSEPQRADPKESRRYCENWHEDF